ncbi:MAG: hypothetical protein WC614_02890 [bacterium]
MNIKKENYYKGLFLTAAFYDFILGILFLFFYKPFFNALSISLPPNPSYLSLSAAFVFVIGIAYFIIYKDIRGNRGLVIVGTAFKIAYVAVGIFYLAIHLVPHMFFMLLALCDAIFGILFMEFLNYTKKR